MTISLCPFRLDSFRVQVIPNAVLIAIVYYPTGQPKELWRVAGVMLFCVQICAVSQAMGLIVSAVSKLQVRRQVA